MSAPHGQNDEDPLKRLDDRIKSLKGEAPVKHHSDEHYSQAHLAWRMVIELVVGLGIGFGIGYGLDVVFETLPLFLVLFILLGFAAGVRTMLRTAQEAQRQTLEDAGSDQQE